MSPVAWEYRTVPVDPFRERFLELERQGIIAADIARRLDWFDRGKADGTRLRRVLGLKPWHGCLQQRVTFEVAQSLADALGLNYEDVGL